MALMVQSGCLGYVIGFESLDPRNLQEMRKTPNLTPQFTRYDEQIEILKDYGLQIWAAFTLGHDHDTPDTIQETVAFALRHKFCFAAFNILMPYPNTPLYRQLAAEGRLLYDGAWWRHPAYRFNHASFRPTRMTADELTDACFRARSEFNSLSSIFHRAWDWRTNMRSFYKFGVYITYNPLFRKETFKKQGMRFGLE